MPAELKSLRIAGWKSIRDATIDFGRLTVLIGANGAGKSNLISFFGLLNEMARERLQVSIAKQGGANAVLHYGVKHTRALLASLAVSSGAEAGRYSFRLVRGGDDGMYFEMEELLWRANAGESETWHADDGESQLVLLGMGGGEAHLAAGAREGRGDEFERSVRAAIESSPSYHFHDVSPQAGFKQKQLINDDLALAPDAANLASMLRRYRVAEPIAYRRIVETVRLVAPFFGDFVLEPSAENRDYILLRWREREHDFLHGPDQTSDGTIRLMALVTLLRQPVARLPPLLILDEPELGLHPYAIGVLAGLLKSVSTRCQVIVATQSAMLLNHFEPDDVVVADRKDGATEFRRLSNADLEDWLEDYSLGALWEKNVFGGGGPH